jgi:hypothetical protein
MSEQYLTRQQQAERYSRHERTVIRWGKDPKYSDLEYPDEIEINGRFLRPLSKLEAWERKRAVKPPRHTNTESNT